LWVKLLACQLEQTDIIEFANIRPNTLQAAYKTGVREIYYFKVRKHKKKRGDNCFVVCPKTAAIRREVPIFKEFHEDILDDSPTYHWCINRKQFNVATFMERRIAMHRLLREILVTKMQPDWYPYHLLESDWEQLKNTSLDRYSVNGSITCFPRQGNKAPKHYRILEHFFDVGSGISDSALWNALIYICKKGVKRINSSNVRKLAKYFVRRRIIDPLAYCTLFKSLGITGAVGDLHPGFGSKALACAIMGLPYYTVKDDRFQSALDKGFSSLTRADFGWLDGQQVELLISDNNFSGFCMPDGDLLDRAKSMLCYVPKAKKPELLAEYNPTNILQIYDFPKEARTFKDPNYLFLW
jgi:hypothetical protein